MFFGQPHPQLQAMVRDTQTFGHLYDTMAAVGDLFDRFSLEFGWIPDSLHDSFSSSISTQTGVY